jgi:CRP-like cAMP-binding protein
MEMNNLVKLQTYLQTTSKNDKKFSVISNWLQDIKIFQDISKEISINDYKNFCMSLQLKNYCGGEIIINNEEVLDKVYIVLIGSIVYKTLNNIAIKTYSQGSIIGENILNSKDIRDCIVYAEHDAILAYFSYPDYKKYLCKYLEVKRIAFVSFLNSQKAFATWSKSNLVELSYYSIERTYEQNTVLFNKGDRLNEIYILIEGQVILIDKNVKRVSAGQAIGLEDLETHDFRTSTGVTVCKSNLIIVFKCDFLKFKRLWGAKAKALSRNFSKKSKSIDLNPSIQAPYNCSLGNFKEKSRDRIKSQIIPNFQQLSSSILWKRKFNAEALQKKPILNYFQDYKKSRMYSKSFYLC